MTRRFLVVLLVLAFGFGTLVQSVAAGAMSAPAAHAAMGDEGCAGCGDAAGDLSCHQMCAAAGIVGGTSACVALGSADRVHPAAPGDLRTRIAAPEPFPPRTA